ncbi:uncharacterized protein L969DRAFT_95116 [Mixia osmundae IAM 14324]|uniref:Uncharacterized protein n=1 Tax=Mixia osmundae (strain CBS 9802 / IAM 14324 / JCM 22182 / KY 12970) TaxID=764103 RepID=G7E746_MIXOS|nr:uncharacterized protein L969DRAFT_95116 [Mixia osmundae IAM 14324]KEI38957.1 hypothetical protein L969DRAFT_95116 [Mixia osmundae IAM 14324]GAA98656.1 hypothetical protein E5Q_05344 [Mixia osmundae IAM 14324]
MDDRTESGVLCQPSYPRLVAQGYVSENQWIVPTTLRHSRPISRWQMRMAQSAAGVSSVDVQLCKAVTVRTRGDDSDPSTIATAI